MRLKPACFYNESEWATWREFARRSGAIVNYCADCTPEYQAKMVKLDLCGHPDVQFRQDADGFIEGYRPASPYARRAQQIAGATHWGPVHVYAVTVAHGGDVKRVIKQWRARPGATSPYRDIDLIGVYQAGANPDLIAEDLAA